jgi:hypothetical protein
MLPLDHCGEDQMAARLGIFLGWIFTSVALVFVALGAWIVYKHPAAPATDNELIAGVLFVAGGIVWLFGRGVRFVLAGPKRNPNYISDFVEKFADPSVPIRKPSAGSRPPGPWDARK